MSNAVSVSPRHMAFLDIARAIHVNEGPKGFLQVTTKYIMLTQYLCVYSVYICTCIYTSHIYTCMHAHMYRKFATQVLRTVLKVYVKFNLQYTKRWSLLTDLLNLCKLVKSVVLNGKLFRKITS